ncbi:hypothetical protein LEP1GSC050_4083 [Leptospira broomii serovar Hurstbridge str. 5399]|uniref:Uncharacterized protein n=1 Tax=Leptospira broomii serovar Hurstbridge str. 5399 TaxID=1049789 RepID=T0F3H1_9LEPT|nr:hypothetical protein LEP1GSC050_4083 [Leptospira broomii serovar Hurstbridge str. 5399]
MRHFRSLSLPNKKQSLILFIIIPLFCILGESDPHDRFPEKRLEMLIPESANEGPWSENPLEFHDLDFLGNFSEDNSKSLIKKAGEELGKALDAFRKTSFAIDRRRKDEEAKSLDSERYDWQRKTRLENFDRVLNRDLARARLETISLLAMASQNLDKVKNPNIKQTSSFLEIQAGVYRELIKHQYAMKNFVQSAGFLEKYIDLDPKFNGEPEPHQLLAHCYERLYLAAKKSKDEDSAQSYLSLRRKHGILYAELKYGQNSYEFKKVMELLARD